MAVIFFWTPVLAAEDLYFDSDGLKIHYVIEGEGEPVLLVHGFTSSIQREWRRTGVLPTLSKTYKVIAIDGRGHGMSEKPRAPEAYGVEMARDVLRLMDHLKLEKSHIVGYSLGGFITEYLVVNHPERLVSATIGGMGWIRAEDQRLALTGALAGFLENGEGIGRLAQRIQESTSTKDEEVPAALQMFVRNDSKALAACARAIPKLAVTEEQLQANQVPTLAIVGGNDLLKTSVDDLNKVMANLKVEVIAGTDHESTLRSPEFVGAVVDFLDAHAPKPSDTNEY